MPSKSGQIRGGVMQGIGTALYEQIPYDDAGQPLAGTLADYLLPGAAEMPAIVGLDVMLVGSGEPEGTSRRGGSNSCWPKQERADCLVLASATIS